MNSKKKILILSDWFYPGYKAGGPIQSIYNLVHALKTRYEIYVLTTNTDHGETKPYENVISDTWFFSDELGVHVFYAQKKYLSKTQIKNQIVAVNAEFVYLNHIYSPLFVVFPLLLKYFNKIKSKLIVCPRGALYESAIAVKSYKKRPLLFILNALKLQKKVLFHATNNREADAIQKYFPGSRIIVANNLPAWNQKEFKSIVKTNGSLNCVFISRIVPIKNLLYVIDVLHHVTSKISFTIAGPKEDIDYWNLCEEKIKTLPSNIRVEYIGSLKNAEITEVLQSNHLFLLPTKGENFGHSIFESFLSGRPVLISDQTPWMNLKEKVCGMELPLSNPTDFIAAVEKFAQMEQDEFDKFAFGAWSFAKDFINNNNDELKYLELFS